MKVKYYLVAPTTRAHQSGYFTYHAQDDLPMGTIVSVEVGAKKAVGVVVEVVKKPAFKTKPVLRVIEKAPLPRELIDLARWMEDYYQAPTSSVWQTILPRGLDKNRRESRAIAPVAHRKKDSFTLNHEQVAAIKKIRAATGTTSLLQGITGSGKTAIYIELARHFIFTEKKSVIVIVPEIALSSQFVAEFSHDFPDILLTHSKLTEAQRHLQWQRALHNVQPCLVIGPRSALFMPLKNIGLIIIDEAHEPSLKQEQAPRYLALRAASVLATRHKAKLVLGSATPNVVDRYIAETSGALVVNLTKSAKKIGNISVQLVDSRKKENFARHRFFSNDMLQAVEQTLKNKQQVLLFHNRRGSAPISLCEHCGWSAGCPRCYVPLVLHNDTYQLMCHVCAFKQKVPLSCPDCGRPGIIHKGIGTKLIVEELIKLFPHARIARFDADNVEADSLQQQYQTVYDGNVDIIVGTQVVAKGLDLPKLAMVGVIQADNGLSLPDFYSEERVFQLLYQVMGRVGRDEKLSTIVVQSFQSDRPPIQAALKKDYQTFYDYTLAKRKHDRFPPFTFLLKLTCVYSSETSAAKAARELKNKLERLKLPDVEILGPTPAFYERVGNTYRWQLVIKSPKRSKLIEILKHIPSQKWQSELDPVSLL
jgi:primosomal protein N' (replication factor Y)